MPAGHFCVKFSSMTQILNNLRLPNAKTAVSALFLVLLFLCSPICCASKQSSLKELLKGRKDAPRLKERFQEELAVEALTHFSMAWQLASSGNNQEAIKELRLAILADPGSAYLHEVMAHILLQEDEHDKAMRQVEKAIRLNPQRHKSYNIKGMIYVDEDELKKAVSSFEKAHELAPHESEYVINLADALTRLGRNEQARQVLVDYVESHPYDIKVRYYVAVVLKKSGRVSEARDVYRQVLILAPRYYPALYDLFHLEIAGGRFEEAARVGNKLVSFFPADAESRMLLSSILVEMGELDGALAVLQNGKRSGIVVPDWWTQRGFILLDKDQAKLAKDEFEAALSIDPKNAEAVFGLGASELALGNEVEGVSLLESVPRDSNLYNEARKKLAFRALKQGNTGRAVGIMEDLLHGNPGNMNVLLMYVGVARQAGEYDKALEALHRALKETPNDVNLLYELGMVHYMADNRDEAIKAMEEILEIKPDSARALNFIAYNWAEQGMRLDDAETNIRKALKIEPGAGYIMDSMGWVYFQRGEFEKAMEWLKKALEKAGSDPEILEHIADCYLAMGQAEKAKENYQKALEVAVIEKLKKRVESKLEKLE